MVCALEGVLDKICIKMGGWGEGSGTLRRLHYFPLGSGSLPLTCVVFWESLETFLLDMRLSMSPAPDADTRDVSPQPEPVPLGGAAGRTQAPLPQHIRGASFGAPPDPHHHGAVWPARPQERTSERGIPRTGTCTSGSQTAGTGRIVPFFGTSQINNHGSAKI